MKRFNIFSILIVFLLAISMNFTSCDLFEDDDDDGDNFVAVTSITISSSAATVGDPLTLTGTVSPSNATNKTITWSLVSEGDTGAELSGSTLTISAAGKAVVSATIANGKARGEAFSENFEITVSAPGVFVPVESITSVPGSGNVGTLTLSGTVNPENASNKNIVWSVKTAGNTGAEINGNILTTNETGTVTVTATIVNGTAAGTNFSDDFEITINPPGSHVAVSGITGVPSSGTAVTPLTLTGTVNPTEATNKTIVWSVENAGTTGATITGNTLSTTAAGTVVIKATITNGTAEGTNFSSNFEININAAGSFVAVSGITGVPTTATVGTPLTLTGTVTPNNATNNTITSWSLPTETTGASITGTTFNATAAGTYTVTATIANGTTVGTNFTSDFTITVSLAGSLTGGWIVETLAGDGTKGFLDGPSFMAQFSEPNGVAVDAAGNVYVADRDNHKIRKIDSAGMVSTLAGDGTPGFLNGPGATAQFYMPSDVAVDAAGNVYVADQINTRIRRIDSTGIVSTLAGDGTPGFLDGPGATARFFIPTGVAVDAVGNVYVTDLQNRRIRMIDNTGMVSTLAGDGTMGFLDGPGATAQFHNIHGIAVDIMGNVYVADHGNRRIRKIDSTGMVSTFAGSGSGGSWEDLDGPVATAHFSMPINIAVDTVGNMYILDQVINRIRKIDSTGMVSTLTGVTNTGYQDGPAATAQFYYPNGIAVDAAGNVYVADTLNHRIRKLTYIEP